MSSLRSVLAMGALALGVAAAPSDANASVSIAVGFDALVKDADAVVLVMPAEHQSIWEDGRIYTYTKVRVEQGIAGDVGAGAEAWVRTMGGVVGKIGQQVDGEPMFMQGKQSMTFLRKFKGDSIFEVSARAQGQFPMQIDEKTKVKKLTRSLNVGVLYPPKNMVAASGVQTQNQSISSQDMANVAQSKIRLAQDVIHERPLDDVSREIATTWKRLHPAPTK